MPVRRPALFALLLASAASGALGAETEAPAAQLDELVVTGEKTDRSIQDTPTSVAVVTGKEIAEQNLVDVYDLINRTANLNSIFGKQGFTIRGIANSNVTGVGTGDLATVYLDGSPLPRAAVNGGPLDLWDLAQVEILRGPQSTLQGRNALAGAIVLKTADPTYEWTGKARAILTDQDEQRRFAAAIGGPIVADQLAFRLAAERSRADGLIENPNRNDDRAGFRDSDAVRAKLLFTPTDLPGLRVVAAYLHDEHSNGSTYSFTDTPDSWKNRTVLGDRATVDKVRSDIGTLDVGYRLSPHLTLAAVTTYSQIRASTVYDGDNLPIDSAYGDFTQDQKTFSEELRLNFERGPFKGLVGGYYSHLDNKHDRSHSVFKLSPVDDLGLPAAISGFYPAALTIDTSQFYPQTVETAAIFGDATWQVAPRIKLHGGFRYDYEHQVRANENTVVLATPLPNPADFGALGPTVAAVNALINAQLLAANSSSPPAKTTYKAFLPKVGVTFEVTDDASLSATVQRGYRSGGSGVNPGRGGLYAYDPEYTWNYELALRSLWLDRRLSLNANAFYVDWKDQQVNVQLSSNVYDYETRNAGSSRIYGFEVESRFQATAEISAYASLGYANTRFKEFMVTGATVADLSGNEFANAPRVTFAAGGTWKSEAGWFVNLNASHRSAAYQAVLDQSRRELKARTLVNAKAGWRNDRYGAYLTAANIFNTHHFDYQYLNGGRRQALLGEPRLVGLTLEASL
ncbi:MAG: TonB-dependent receptor [Phenylobacterium sp.]|uniref:TonB-dependent receptor n=1 Tax=Phenylobacterium sp. TaxID=1871053 RepID=UPI0012272505|nr:TonB-dependent receptor [Phenylobacterium sp.]TAJ68984.1 MAG: TonB-dependent receptor [Phenylobacterium sp.]